MDFIAAQSQQGIWIGFYHGLFLVPQACIEGSNVEHAVGPLPTPWQAVSKRAIFAIGEVGGHKIYIAHLLAGASRADDDPPMPTGFSVGVLRSFLSKIPDVMFAVLSRGAQILRWHSDYQFCPKCGAGFPGQAIVLDPNAENVKICTNCNQSQYPRLSPCVLVLVFDDRSTSDVKLLLAHGQRHPPGFWSTLAGFIEPGETAEAAVSREVAEEVGVSVTDLVYRGSQSWPFPHALMLGFWARAGSTDLKLDAREILAAKWVSCDALRAQGLPSGQSLPPVGTLSRQLIDDYLALSR